MRRYLRRLLSDICTDVRSLTSQMSVSKLQPRKKNTNEQYANR